MNEKYLTGYAVFPEYELITINNERFIQPVNASDIKFEDMKLYTIGSPENDYISFSKIIDEDSLLKFVRQYGLLGTNKIITNEHLPRDVVVSSAPDKVKDCLDMAYAIRTLIKYWRRPQKVNDIFNQQNQQNGGEMSYDYDFLESQIKPSIRGLIEGNNFDESTIIRIYVAYNITNYIRNLKATIKVTPNGNILPAFNYSSLHETLWQQFYIHITKNVTYKECPYCRQPHTGSRRFCPKPPQLKGRSQCENNYNQLKHRKMPIVKELLLKGYNILDIADQINVHSLMIENWIKDGE